MAIPAAALIPLALGAASTTDSILSRQGARRANKENKQLAIDQQRWNIDQWHRETAENQRLWEQTNAYNTPQQQMARFAEAGLNPHLIYGKGSSGNANNITSPDVKPYNRAESQNVMKGISAFKDIAAMNQIQAQTDNVKANTDLAKQNSAKVAVETQNTAVQGNLYSQQLREKTGLEPYNLQAGMANANKAMVEADIAQSTKQPVIDKAIQELNNMKKIGNNLKLENAIKTWHANLAKQGLSPNDSRITRAISWWLNSSSSDKSDKMINILNNLNYK